MLINAVRMVLVPGTGARGVVAALGLALASLVALTVVGVYLSRPATIRDPDSWNP